MKQKIYLLCLLFCSLICQLHLTAQPSGYTYVRELVIQETMVPDGPSLANYPFLVRLTSPSLRSVANGGHMESNQAHDLVFYMNGCATMLEHQLDYYDPVTGELVVWVRIPVVSTTSNTSVFMYYGNSSVLSSSSSTGTWNAGYNAVWHLTENPAGAAPQMQDGTAGGHHGTTHGSMGAGQSITGKIGRAIQFDESNDYIRIPDFLYGQELTVSFWFNLSEVNGTTYQYLYSHGPWATQNSMNVYIGEDNITIPAEIRNRRMLKTNYRDSNDANNFDTLDAGNTLVDGNWHYYCLRIQDFGGAYVFIDGVPVINYSVWGATSYDPVTDIFLGGREDLHAQRFYGGALDEVRISSVWRTANWIRTEFNNQNDPASFFATGPEGYVGSFCFPLSVKLTDFEAFRKGKAVELRWHTAGQAGFVHYSVERSRNGIDWTVAGELLNGDHFSDLAAPAGTVYYRLRYRYEGQDNLTPIRKVQEPGFPGSEILLYPNPSIDRQILALFSDKRLLREVRIYDAMGRFIRSARFSATGAGSVRLDPGRDLQRGIYLLHFEFGDGTEMKRLVIR